MQPIIFHLDMNSYFASVEQQDHAEYRGKPLGVCEHLGGIIIAASIEAKRWGIKTGTPVWEARKLYPKIILTKTSPQRYRFYTRRFIKVVEDYTDKVEPYSIDEVFFDGTKACNIRLEIKDLRLKQEDRGWQLVNPFEEAVRVALTIKKRMKSEVGDWLTCSIGIADNKLLAKIGSDMKKPNGIVVIKPSLGVIPRECYPPWLDCQVETGRAGESLKVGDSPVVKGFLRSSAALVGRDDTENVLLISKDGQSSVLAVTKDELYSRLKLTDIPGIGHRQEKNLQALGVRTLSDLRDYPKSHLVSRFGPIMGHHIYNLGQLQGTWKAPVQREEQIKSMGHMYTLPKDYRKPEFFLPVLYKLCEMVARRLRRKQLMGNVIHFYFYNQNYHGSGGSSKLGYNIQDGREVFLESLRLCRSFIGQDLSAFPPGTKLIGVIVAGLKPFVGQLSLFGHSERQQRLLKSLDKINDKYGEFTVCRTPVLKAKAVFSDSIGFGRIKELS